MAPRKTKATMIEEGSSATSKHLDNTKKETKASGEHKYRGGTLMEGVVVGLPRKISPPIVDGIYRGIPRHTAMKLDSNTSSVMSSATKNMMDSFGSGIFPEGAR